MLVIGEEILNKSYTNTKKKYKKAIFPETDCHESLKALLVSQLILLNKSPGVGPIGIGQVLRKIISKAAMSVVEK